MTDAEHENYAKDILSSLLDNRPEVETVKFQSDETQSRNAANAMAAILCHRLFKRSGDQPKRITNTTYEWKAASGPP